MICKPWSMKTTTSSSGTDHSCKFTTITFSEPAPGLHFRTLELFFYFLGGRACGQPAKLTHFFLWVAFPDATFISATDTIRKMKTQVDSMEAEIEKLSTNMDETTKLRFKALFFLLASSHELALLPVHSLTHTVAVGLWGFGLLGCGLWSAVQRLTARFARAVRKSAVWLRATRCSRSFSFSLSFRPA